MVEADSVPSSTRRLITGESANQSTNLRAIGLKPIDRRHFIGGSDARVIMGIDEAPLLPHDVKLEDLSNHRWYEANTGQGPMGSTNGAPFYPTAAFFVRLLPRNILLILLVFLSRNKRLRFSAFDGVSSNRLVRSKPQGRLR